MGVVNTKSNRVTLAEAVPMRADSSQLSAGVCKQIVATVAVAAADDDTSVFRLCRVHSSWTLPSCILFNDALTSGTDWDLGLYQTAENGGAEVDKDVYADGFSLATASVVGVERAFGTRDINKVENRVWQDAGLSADPGVFYDLCLTANTIGSAAGDITAIVSYVRPA